MSGSKSNDKLSPDYVPSIFSQTESPRKRKAEQNLHTYTRRKEARRRRSKALNREAVSRTDLLSLTEGDTETLKDDEGSTEVETTYLSMKDAATMTDMNFVNLEEECCHLRCEKLKLEKSLKHTSFDEKDLNGNDEKVKFYTGLPTYATLIWQYLILSLLI